MLNAANIAPKSIISVMMKTHMPSVALSRCCSGVANCSRNDKLVGSAKVQFLPLRFEVVGLPGDHRCFFKVVGDGRRGCLPFQAGGAPGIVWSGPPVLPRPDEIDQRDDIAN